MSASPQPPLRLRARLRRRRVAGFTLVEMMVALVAGAMAIATVYTLGAGSSRAFREQQRVTQTQAAVRAAMDQLRRDISRAGFGATPNSDVDAGANPAGCDVTANGVRLVGAVINDDAYTGALAMADANNVQADGLVLTGNFATGDHYLVSTIAAGTQISLQQSRQSFRRSFGVPLDAQRFEDVFRVGRWIYMVSETGRRVARPITGVSGATATITVSPSIPVACFGYGRGARISPVMRIEYFAADPNDYGPFAWLVPPGNAAAQANRGMTPAVLGRREVTFGDGFTTIANSERVVMEYLAHIDYAATVNTATAPVPPTMTETLDAAGASGAAALAAAPHRGVAIRVNLAGRTAGVDRNFVWRGTRASMRDPLQSYLSRLPSGGSVGASVGVAAASRVRVAEEVVVLENIVNRMEELP